MKEDVLSRVLEIYKKKSTSETQFAKQIGANQKTINQQLKGERSLSLDTVLLIINTFEDVSAEWLLRGTETTSIYPRIKELADIRGISMYTLSQDTGISQSVLSRLKTESTAKLSRKNLEILANYFCVNIDWLATGRGDRYAPGIVKDTKIHDDALWERIEKVAIECFAPSDNKTIEAVDYHQFSTVTSIPEERLHDILQNNEFPYYSEILKIANVEILNLNLEWLFLGKGDMYLKASSNAEIEELKAEINMLKGENNILREQLGLSKRAANAKSA